MVNRIGCWIGLALLVSACSGCGVLYTVVEVGIQAGPASVPMTKAEVIDQIGRPDRVLRDDGRLLSGNTLSRPANSGSMSWPSARFSIWVGGCIFYPFTNLAAEHQREYPYHIVLVNGRTLCVGHTLGHYTAAPRLCLVRHCRLRIRRDVRTS